MFWVAARNKSSGSLRFPYTEKNSTIRCRVRCIINSSRYGLYFIQSLVNAHKRAYFRPIYLYVKYTQLRVILWQENIENVQNFNKFVFVFVNVALIGYDIFKDWFFKERFHNHIWKTLLSLLQIGNWSI